MATEQQQPTVWALGDYARVAREVLADLGTSLVAACGIAEGQRVLDVATGSGNAAIPAARSGARVVASDITPGLLESGR
jgi:ubiquinone/menaquinone biosynthesis C-methylase UbiE